MARLLLLVAVGLATARGSFGQADLLTWREAIELVSLVPDVLAARDRGECPAISVQPVASEQAFTVEARGVCPAPGFNGSMLINSYVVNRTTGDVRIGLGSVLEEPVNNPEMKSRARALTANARSRLLSASDAQCVALKAARDALPADSDGVVASTKLLGEFEKGKLWFGVERRFRGTVVFPRDLTVDLRRFTVREDAASFDLSGPGLAALLVRMKEIREPLALSTEDAIRVAGAAITPATRPDGGCYEFTATVDEAFSWEQYVDIHNKCQSMDSLVAVNILTGRLSDPKTGQKIDSPEAQAVAKRLFARLSETRSSARSAIGSVCQAPGDR